MQRRPCGAEAGTRVEIGGRNVQTLRCDPGETVPFAISFETASERLAALPGAYVEPDGSFSLRGESGWRVVGCLFDRDGAVLYVELRGDCPADALSTIIGLLGETAETSMIQLPELGLWVGAQEFATWRSG